MGGANNLGYGAFTSKGRYVYASNVELPGFVSIVDATNPDTLLRDPTLWPNGIVVSGITTGNLLLLGLERSSFSASGYALAIYDISNPASPTFLSELPDIGPNGFTVRGSIVYTTGYGALRAVDISEPSHPKLVGSTIAGGAKVTTADKYLTIAGYRRAYIVDISVPDSLLMKSIFPTGGLAERVFLQDTLAYVASETGGLWILNVSNPSMPRSVSNINVGGAAYNVVVSGSYAYLMNWAQDNTDTARGLWIIDVSDPSHPRAVTHYIGITRFYGGGVPNAVAKSGNLLAITQMPTSGDDRVLEIVDVNNARQPTSLGVFHATYAPYKIALVDSFAYLATEADGLRVIDFHSPSAPIEVYSFNNSFSYSVRGIATHGSYAYADRIDTFFDMTTLNPAHPSVLGQFGRNYGSFTEVDMSADSPYVYWAEGYLGTVDVSRPDQPVNRSLFLGKDWGTSVSASKGLVLFADRTQGIWLFRNNLVTSVPISGKSARISGYELSQNYPNPFNGMTVIQFANARQEKIALEIFDILGEKVTTLLDDVVMPGVHKVPFSPKSLATGLYFYQFRANLFKIARPMLYLK